MSENGKTWFRLRWRTLFLLAVVVAVGWSGYSYWSEYSERAARKSRELMAPAAGAQCSVIFHRDELGIDRTVLNPSNVGGVDNYVRGKFVKLNDDWIVIAPREGEQVWIPHEHVLLLRVEP